MTLIHNVRVDARTNDPVPGTGHAAPDAATRPPAPADVTPNLALVAQPSPGDIESTRTRFQALTGMVLCAWQAFVTLLCNRAIKHIFLLAPCGAGKTLAFVSTLLFNLQDIVIIVSPLLTLGKQHVQNLIDMGIAAVELTGKTISDGLIKSIAACRYRAIVAPPEIINSDRRVRRLLKVPEFARRFKRLVLDEIHCMLEWSSFRPDYKNFDLFLSMMPSHARILCASATVTDDERFSIIRSLHMSEDATELVRLNNDCPNLFYIVIPMPGAVNNYEPLLLLLPDNYARLPPVCDAPPLFMVFMNSKIECVQACLYLMSRLPIHHRDKVCWFFSDMTDEFKAQKLDDLKEGRIWGMFCTDSAGLGLDVKKIIFSIQWGIKNLTFGTVYQRFGRAGRDREVQAAAVLFVESAYWPSPETQTAVKREAEEDGPPPKRVKIEEPEVYKGFAGAVVSHITTQIVEVPAPDSAAPAAPTAAAEPTPSRIPIKKGSEVNRTARKKSKVDPVVLRFIAPPQPSDDDADDTHTCRACRRSVPREHYHSADVHGPAPESPDCKRCAAKPPTICCDLDVYNDDGTLPDAVPAYIRRFLLYQPPQAAKTKNRVAPRHHYKPGDKEEQLKLALRDWRARRWPELFPRSSMGSTALLSDSVIDRIARIAHRCVLTTTDRLAFETGWSYALKHGAAVIMIILRYFSPAPATPDPVVLSDATNAAPGSPPRPVKARAPPTCSMCVAEGDTERAVGHRKGGLSCPYKAKYDAARAQHSSASTAPTAGALTADVPTADAVSPLPEIATVPVAHSGTPVAIEPPTRPSYYRQDPAAPQAPVSGSYYREQLAAPVAGPSQLPAHGASLVPQAGQTAGPSRLPDAPQSRIPLPRTIHSMFRPGLSFIPRPTVGRRGFAAKTATNL